MAIVNGYLELSQLKAALGDSSSTYDALYERVIEAASRQIDRWYGDQFWREPAAAPRLFRPDQGGVIWTGVFADDATLAVASDEDGDGVFETVWAAAEFSAEPLVRRNGEPFDRVVALGRWFPLRAAAYGRRASVQVTAEWGWPQVPPEVESACRLLAVDLFKSKDLTGGVAGFSELGPVRIPAFNPQAEALLAPLRPPAIA